MASPQRTLDYEICRVSIDDEVVAPLIGGLATEYTARYGGDHEMHQSRPSDFAPPAGAFYVALEEGRTIAGGGYRRFSEGVCEVKRLWTSPVRRRRGVAGAVLSALETAAAEGGYRSVVLETGPNQPEAVAFYQARGYHRIETYGRYERALAFERQLRPPGPGPRPAGELPLP